MTIGKKESQFTRKTTIIDSDFVRMFVPGQNLAISFSDFKLALGVTGELNQVGDPLGAPILDKESSTLNNIRNMESGAGILFSVSAQNGVIGKWNVAQNTEGVPIISGLDDKQPVMSSLTAGAGVQIDKSDDEIIISTVDGAGGLNQDQLIYVAKAGSDANAGLNINTPKLTIQAAITDAIALIPAVDNQITIEVTDTGTYVESPTLPEWVHLDASNAALTGRLTVEDNTITSFRRLQNTNTSQPVARKANGLGFAKLAVELLIVAGSAQEGLLVDAGVMHIDAGVLSIDAGTGIKAKNGSRVSFVVSEIQLLNGGLGIGTRASGGGANFFSGNILYAKDDGSGVFVEAKVSGDTMNIQAGSIIVDTLYDMGAGATLNVFATEAVGDINKNATATINATLAGNLTNRIIVNQASDLAGTLDSTKQYFINGIIDMGSQSIEVPSGGVTLTGYSFDLSRLTSSEAAYTMFTSPAGGSGNVLGMDYAIEVTGAGSQVYDLVSDTGLEAFEFTRINYNNCSSLGSIDNYRQGLEIGTGRFGGKPELTLVGVWLGGYFIDTSNH